MGPRQFNPMLSAELVHLYAPAALLPRLYGLPPVPDCPCLEAKFSLRSVNALAAIS